MSDTGESRGSSWARWTGAVEASGTMPPSPPVSETPAEGAEEEEPAEPTAGDDGHSDDDDRGRGAELLAPVPLLPAIAGRVDAVDGQLRALGMRIDVLASSVGALRSAIGDRIDAYADAAASSARQADHAIEEQRRATERALAELRRSLAGTDDVLRQVSTRLDEIATDVTSLLSGGHPTVMPPPPPEAAPQQDSQLAAVVDAVAGIDGRITDLAGALAQQERAGSDGAAPPVSLEPLEQAIAEIRTLVEVVVDTMPASSEGSGTDLAERVADAVLARIDVDALADSLADRLEQRFEVVVENP